ncbi:MAG: LysR family transcriptional regulator [Herminiimonas sp.]|nr:LysR family transcriptional regulator [Herminiimonas sp.]
MHLNLRQIEVFRTIMLTSSISGAAKLLHVSQPAVSRLLSHTEQRLGLQLFERIKGRLYATPEAKQLLVEVNAVYQSVQRVNEVTEDIIEQRTGFLRLACTANLSQSLLPKAIGAFLKQFCDVRIILKTTSPTELLNVLLTQQVELGIAYMPIPHPNLKMSLLYENRIVAVLPQSHRLADYPEIHISDLVGEPFIGYASDIPIGQLVRQLFDSIDHHLAPRVEVQQVHVACGLVRAGVGIALADEQTVLGGDWPDLVIKRISPNIPTPVHVFHFLYQPLSWPAKEFVKTLTALSLEAA